MENFDPTRHLTTLKNLRAQYPTAKFSELSSLLAQRGIDCHYLSVKGYLRQLGEDVEPTSAEDLQASHAYVIGDLYQKLDSIKDVIETLRTSYGIYTNRIELTQALESLGQLETVEYGVTQNLLNNYRDIICNWYENEHSLRAISDRLRSEFNIDACPTTVRKVLIDAGKKNELRKRRFGGSMSE